jgi:hypothetical protein
VRTEDREDNDHRKQQLSSPDTAGILTVKERAGQIAGLLDRKGPAAYPIVDQDTKAVPATGRTQVAELGKNLKVVVPAQTRVRQPSAEIGQSVMTTSETQTPPPSAATYDVLPAAPSELRIGHTYQVKNSYVPQDFSTCIVVTAGDLVTIEMSIAGWSYVQNLFTRVKGFVLDTCIDRNGWTDSKTTREEYGDISEQTFQEHWLGKKCHTVFSSGDLRVGDVVVISDAKVGWNGKAIARKWQDSRPVTVFLKYLQKV